MLYRGIKGVPGRGQNYLIYYYCDLYDHFHLFIYLVLFAFSFILSLHCIGDCIAVLLLLLFLPPSLSLNDKGLSPRRVIRSPVPQPDAAHVLFICSLIEFNKISFPDCCDSALRHLPSAAAAARGDTRFDI